MGGAKPRVEPNDVHGLPYLKMVAKETLLLQPPVLLPRETGADLT